MVDLVPARCGGAHRSRLRVRFCKVGKVRFTSHRDVARMWERALRRTGVPVAYTAGFTPRPRLSFGLALPTGYESWAEYLDIEVRPDRYRGEEVTLVGHDDGRVLHLGALGEALGDALPTGIDVHAVHALEGRVDSLQEEVTACTWRFGVRGLGRAEAEAAVARLLGSTKVTVERFRKGAAVLDDVRPAVQELRVGQGGCSAYGPTEVEFVATLGAKPHVIRPSELVAALAPGREMGIATRTHQWIERRGQRVEPLPPPAAGAPHPLGGAS